MRMFHLGASELILILVIALVVFGPGKLPEVGKAIGKAFKEFRQATNFEAGIDSNPHTPQALSVENKGQDIFK